MAIALRLTAGSIREETLRPLDASRRAPAGPHGIVYGFVQHPYPVKLTLSSAGRRWTPHSVLLRGTTFYISALPHPSCWYHAMTVRAVNLGGPSWSGHTDITLVSCTPGELAVQGGSGSGWGPGPGN